jgi:periplasmic copper chaperone A
VKIRWLILSLIWLLTACSAGGPPGITVSDAWVRPSPLPGGTGAAYLVIHNGGPGVDTLIGASTDIANTSEVHQSVHDGDMVMMHPADAIEISVGQDVVMEPDHAN